MEGIIKDDIPKDIANIICNGLVNYWEETPQDAWLYSEYKNGKSVLLLAHQRELYLLRVLENLGFPMDKVGTYYFKDLILEIVHYLKEMQSGEEDEFIKSSLCDPYSQLYFNVARNDLDIGIKLFHELIFDALSNIDLEDYTDFSSLTDEEINMPYLAYQLALYISGKSLGARCK